MPETQTPQFKLPDGFKLQVGGVLPGETALAAALEYAGVVRQTMSQENRDELDRLNLKFYRAWLKLFGIE
jgi:hypothetical protein